jgi:predicted PurR-regulated permease PerM
MLVVTALYFGKPILVPLTIAVLLTFLLNPVVNALHRWHLSRPLAVFLVVISVFSALGSATYALGRQVTQLAAELPEYKGNIIRKIAEFRSARHSRVLQRLERTFHEIVGEIQRDDGVAAEKKAESAQASPAKKAEEKPVPVVVESDQSRLKIVPPGLGSVAEWVVAGAMVVVLVIFMLLRLQDLRNRVLRLVGYSRLTSTTKALDDAAARISRYLLMQSLINTTYGCCVGFGLFMIGLPYVVVLGFIAGVMRFVPYVGPPLGALLPLALSFALFHYWVSTVLVVGLFVFLEALTSMLIEPRVYGQSAGVSEVALLVAIAFWTWLWGPIGLALATPLTVCLVVACKYVPELESVAVLLGDEPPVDLSLIYYQRLLARDTDEAAELVQSFLKDNPAEQIFDRLFVPALHWAKRDAALDKLDSDEQQFIAEATRELIEAFSEVKSVGADVETEAEPAPLPSPLKVVACPARDVSDELTLQMLARLLDSKRFDVEVLSSEKLISEMVAAIRAKSPDLLCVGSLMPDSSAALRRLCKRLRDCFPAVRILVCRLPYKESEPDPEPFLAAGADSFRTTLIEVRNHLLTLSPVLSQGGGARPAAASSASDSARAA